MTVDARHTGECIECGDPAGDEPGATWGSGLVMCGSCADEIPRRDRREVFLEVEERLTREETDDDGVHWKINEDRWVEKRTQFLSSNEIGLREPIARAVALVQIGYTASGIASEMDVTEGTAKIYTEQANRKYGGITAADPDAETVQELTERGIYPDECPVCASEKVWPVPAARRIFPHISKWGAAEMLEDDSLVCSWCHSVNIDGSWHRMQTEKSRAREIADAGNKSFDEAQGSVSAGPAEPEKLTPSGGGGATKAADDAEEIEEW